MGTCWEIESAEFQAESSRVTEFADKAFLRAQHFLGEPRWPVNRVALKYQPNRQPETVPLDRQQGSFRICIGVIPSDHRFNGQLGHEVGHLLNPDLRDWYVEGLTNVFAVTLLDSREQKQWQDYFESDLRSKEDPYGVTYLMMREICEATEDEHIRGILRHRRPGCGRWEALDTNGWLKELPSQIREKVRDILAGHGQELERAVQACSSTYPGFSFNLPHGATV